MEIVATLHHPQLVQVLLGLTHLLDVSSPSFTLIEPTDGRSRTEVRGRSVILRR